MRNVVLGILALVALALVPVPSRAASGGKMAVDVPFEFTVGEKVLPAGRYIVERSALTRDYFFVRSAEGGKSAITLVLTPLSAGADTPTSALVFNDYNGTRFLSQIWLPGRGAGSQLHVSDAEEDLAEAQSTARVVLVAVRE